MAVWELLLIGVGLAMDAVAVGMTNGMVEPKMKWWKVLLIAGMFGLFQALMPAAGYLFGYAFSFIVEKIAPWLSFVLLAFIGGKMLFDSIKEMREGNGLKKAEDREPLGLTKLLVQAVATSIDALAVGVTLLALDTSNGLPMSAIWCFVVIGVVTFLLVLPAVIVGKKAGDKFSDKAGIVGGIILIGIGIKILLEGIL